MAGYSEEKADLWLCCSHKPCRKKVKNDSWNKRDAYDAGWMMQRNGDNWCPDHLPEWVAEWRKKREKR